ncbi:potassium transporter Kup [Dietzia sp. ANT_WB102]|uniref:potassium transporter Kup n=1 Tax=Dietzia sp. ANT_WB102 TaxID=2597345 RepID=UPI0011ED1E46|nr:KUP/HAK/KT family potassium transporter [Dietzia sp. ANT_WB102]KAA0919267.1 potassium transporter Kup [Dietzia sp. ANT_WB102]
MKRPGQGIPHSTRHRRAPRRGGERGAGVMTLGALGVVFGDIGTSPLYALHTAFSFRHNAVAVTPDNVYGIISMVLWTITIIVTIKFVMLVIRADNDGEGGILALVALLRRHLHGRRAGAVVTVLGVLGAGLFFGDAVITPTISVLSAVEGLSVVNPSLGSVVVPVAVGMLALLFFVQPVGTARVSWAFGPVMLVWFVVLAVLGIPHIVAHPSILVSLSPTWAVELMFRHPFQAFVLLGAVVLTVTGAEALYADLGHFSASAIRRAWFVVVLPALALVYLGQGALVISRPDAVSNPLFHLAPGALQVPLVVLATAATIIASQAVISGAFSIARQAMRLSLLPRLTVRYTSRDQAGQIYVPALNWLLFVTVVSLVVTFGSSASLANAYGFAVTGTLVLESGLFLMFAVSVWRWRWPAVVLYVVTIGALEVLLLAANATKIIDGGWLPVLLAAAVVVVMMTWRRGNAEVSAARRELEGPLTDFLTSLGRAPVGRGPAVAVFPHANPDTTPLALVSCVTDLQIFPDQVVIVRLEHCNVPHVRLEDKYVSEHLDSPLGALIRLTVRVGFADPPDIPTNLRQAKDQLDLDIDLAAATYFLSVLSLRPSRTPGLRHWRERLFLSLERNQANRTEAFHLPPQRTVVLGEELHI